MMHPQIAHELGEKEAIELIEHGMIRARLEAEISHEFTNYLQIDTRSLRISVKSTNNKITHVINGVLTVTDGNNITYLELILE